MDKIEHVLSHLVQENHRKILEITAAKPAEKIQSDEPEIVNLSNEKDA